MVFVYLHGKVQVGDNFSENIPSVGMKLIKEQFKYAFFKNSKATEAEHGISYQQKSTEILLGGKCSQGLI